MPIIYAAPYVLRLLRWRSGHPSFRRFAVPALVGPLAFGFCSLAGWISSALLLFGVLHLHSNAAYLLIGEGLLFYLLPGLLGAWLAVKVVRFFERALFSTPEARRLELSFVTGCIGGPIGFLVGMGFASSLLPLGSSYWAFIVSLVTAGMAATLTFALCMLFMRKPATPATTVAPDPKKTPILVAVRRYS